MKKQETYAVRFIARKSKAMRNGKSPLSVRVTVNSQRVEISLGWYVTESIWDEKMQKCKGSTREAKGTNGFIDATIFKLTDIRQRLIIEGKEVTADFIKARYKGLPDPDEIENPTLLELYDEHNRKFKELIGTKNHSASTYQRHLTSKGHAQTYIKAVYGKEDLPFDKINFKFLNDYEHYLKSVRKCNHNSTMKYIKNLGKVINLAYAEGYLTLNPFNKYKLTYDKVQRVALTESEIEKIQQLEMDDERLEKVKDLFLFCIYTGLAFVDVVNLKIEHLYEDKDGNWWIKNNRYKTSIEFLIPMLPVPLNLMKKYENHPVREQKGKVLPTLSNQKYNAYLKEIATLAKIKKNLSSHIARHTFATTIGLENGIPLEIVSKMLGHTCTRTTLDYAKVNERVISNCMDKMMDKD